jgi:flagellar basal-body rod modification protein FlgD
MSSIGPSTSGSGTSSTGTSTTQTKTKSLGKDDFLKLLVTQLSHQDPLKPMDDTQFMSQMAQFSTLEQMTNMSGELERLSFSGQVSQAVGLIGRAVTYEKKDGSTAQGTVQGIDIEDGKILVTIDGDKVEPGSIRSVA